MTTAQRQRHRVVQVCGYYPPRLGGVENVAQALAELLAQRHDVHVVTTRCGSGDAPSKEYLHGVRVSRFAGVVVAHTPLSLGLALRILGIGRRSIVHLHIAGAFVPEIVLVTSFLRRRPYIAHFHMEFDPSGPLGVLLSTYKRRVLGPVLRRAAAVIVLSDEQARFLSSVYGVGTGRITVIPNGVGPSFYPTESDSDAFVESLRATRLLYVGRLDAQKNPARLIDAMTHVSASTELAIVGDGELREDVANRVRRLNLTNVTLVGSARGEDLLRWYRWADAFILPSDREGMPLVLLEAMAAGLAIIATDVPGTRDVVGNAGLLAAPNPESLGAAIDRVASDSGFRADLAHRSLAAGRAFRWDAGILELERLYDAVASSLAVR